MSVHSMWVHGNSARTQLVGDPPLMQVQDVLANGFRGGLPYSEVVGMPTGPQIVFRGRDRSRGPGGSRVVPQPSTYFHFAIPTPVIVRGVSALITTIFVLWKADPGIALQEVYAFDGPRNLRVAFATPVGGGRDGNGGPADLILGMTRFPVPTQSVLFGVGISLGFGFSADGNLAFSAAGAAFELPGV